MARKEITRKKIRNRKGYLPSFLTTLFLWFLIFFIIFFIDPATVLIIPVVLLLIFLAIFLTVSISLSNNRVGLITALGIITFAILRYWGIGNAINLLLIIGLSTAAEFYFRNY